MSNGNQLDPDNLQADSQSHAEDAREVRSALAHQNTARKSRPRATWHATAFVLEAVVLLFFIAVSMAVVCSLFAKAFEIDQEADTLARAVTLATTGADNGAETFVANPDDESCPATMTYSFDGESFAPQSTYVSGMYTVKRTVEADKTAAGTLYRARIDVGRYNDNVYSLTVACYKSKSGETKLVSTDDGAGKEKR